MMNEWQLGLFMTFQGSVVTARFCECGESITLSPFSFKGLGIIYMYPVSRQQQSKQRKKLKISQVSTMAEEEELMINLTPKTPKTKKSKKKKKKNLDMEVEDEPSAIEEAQNHSTMEEDEEEEEEEDLKLKPQPKTPKTKNSKKIEKLDATIQVVREHSDKLAPLIGYFPSGFNPISKDESESPKVRVFRHTNKTNRMQLVVSPKNGSEVDFVGSSYAGEAATRQVCTYALGVLDKEAKTLKIVPIASNKIFRLEPRVVGSDPIVEDEPSSSLKENITAEQEKAMRTRELNQLYGTKRSITMAKKLDSLKAQEDPDMKEDLDRQIQEVAINKDALVSDVASTTARNIPPYDSSATSPELAYPLDKIILKGEWDYLLDIFHLFQAGHEVAPDAYPSFVCNRIHKLGEIQDETDKMQVACILTYITHLIKFKDQHSMDGVSSAKHHKMPSILRHKFSTMFAGEDSKRMSDEKNAFIISYVLVLTLFVDDFRTDPSDIAKDLRMSPVTLRIHFEHLGCKMKREKNAVLATLPVPLNFPSLKRRRRK